MTVKELVEYNRCNPSDAYRLVEVLDEDSGQKIMGRKNVPAQEISTLEPPEHLSDK